ncbi:transposase [Escherichia coli]|nr:transposase [Escherichia coli]MHV09463.1 transposase [Escherichia coli]MIC40321.1 transposase [Escherichia coli]HBY0199890.1 transposase [Klebsiella pneumoniae]
MSMSPSGTLRFETRPGYQRRHAGKKLIWWLQGNSAPGLTAASLNHAEYQRRALPVKRETESYGDDPKQNDNQ